MNDLKRVQDFVDRFDLGLKVINHDNDTSTAEKAAETLGLEVGQIAKSCGCRDAFFFFTYNPG